MLMIYIVLINNRKSQKYNKQRIDQGTLQQHALMRFFLIFLRFFYMIVMHQTFSYKKEKQQIEIQYAYINQHVDFDFILISLCAKIILRDFIIIKYRVMEEKVQAKMGVHQLLTKNGFYRLPMHSLSEILKLLEMPESLEPKNIQENAINGLIKVIQKYGNKYSQYVNAAKYNAITKETKEYVNILLQDTLNLFSKKNIYSSPNSQMPPLISQQMAPPIPPVYPPINHFMRPPIPPPHGNNLEDPEKMRMMEEQMRMQQQMFMYYYGMYGYPNPMFSPASYMNYPQFQNPQPNKPGTNPLPPANTLNRMNLPNNANPSNAPNQLNNPMAPKMMPGMNAMAGMNAMISMGQMPPMGQMPNMNQMPNMGQMPPMGQMPNMNQMPSMNQMASMNPMHPLNPMNPQNGMGMIGNQMGGYNEMQKIIHQKILNTPKNNQEQPQVNANNQNIPKNIPRQNTPKPVPQIPKSKSIVNDDQKKNKEYFPQTKALVEPKKYQKKKKEDSYMPDKRIMNVNPSPPFIVNEPSKKTSISNSFNELLRYCACRGLQKYDEQFLCNICNRTFHFQCLGESLKKYGTGETIQCYHCRMRFIDPLNKVKQVIAEYYIPNILENKFWVQCNLKPYEYLCRPKGGKNEIEMRCLKVCLADSNEITWPDQCIIKLNGQRIIEIPALQINSSLKKRKDYSIIITQNIYNKSNESDNQALEKVRLSLEIRNLNKEELGLKKIKNNYSFAFAIYFIQRLTIDDLYQKIVSEEKVPEPVDYIPRLMRTSENDIEIDKIIVSLFDPFTWDLIKTPVRGHKCHHGQCFDLKIFISFMMTTRNRTWKCPVCGKDARKFMIDSQQCELIKQVNQKNAVPSEIAFLKDGRIVMKLSNQEANNDDEQEGKEKMEKTKKIRKQKKYEKSDNSVSQKDQKEMVYAKQLQKPEQKQIRQINLQDEDDEYFPYNSKQKEYK